MLSARSRLWIGFHPCSEEARPTRKDRILSKIRPMQFSDFRRLFEGGIRSLLSWDLLEKHQPLIQKDVLTEKSAISNMLTVWYRDSSGCPSTYEDPTARPQTVEQVTHPGLPPWKSERVQRINQFRSYFGSSSEPVVLLVPCFLTSRGLLILDSSHRVVGAYLSGREVRVLSLSLVAPESPDLLPDLARL